MNDVSALIEEVIRLDLGPTLKGLGFKKSGRSFYRHVDKILQIVNVQSSQRNYAGRGTFTINLGVFYPAVSKTRGLSVSKTPKEYDSTLRTRIGKLLPGGLDHWWEVDSGTRISALAEEINRAVVDQGVPWLEKMLNLPAVLEALDAQGDELMAASVALELGRRERAAELVRSALRNRPL